MPQQEKKTYLVESYKWKFVLRLACSSGWRTLLQPSMNEIGIQGVCKTTQAVETQDMSYDRNVH